MRAIVLREFPYSKDGIHVEMLSKDHVFECREDLTKGLTAEKFIAEAPDAELTPPGVEYPADVQQLVDAADAAERTAAAARLVAKDKPKTERQAAFVALKGLDEAAAAARVAADEAIAVFSA